ncbi:type I pantothenate kinase [Leuconostocaceae bacterium ESL0958]|nr:type I pantothenate kinase [Leuconostocaceae bacterium ESL0958]
MTLAQKIYEAHQGSFLTVGLTGSVAVGKSTQAAYLAADLRQRGLTATVVSTDDFLRSNASLQAAGIFHEKGFPQSYRLAALADFIRNFQAGQAVQTIGQYSQTLADIDKAAQQAVARPDVLIIEGVVALQLPTELLDQTVFLEADLTDIKNWYLQRNMLATVQSAEQADSWRQQYLDYSLRDFAATALAIWAETNQANYDRYILPSREQADWVLSLDSHHRVQALRPGPRWERFHELS